MVADKRKADLSDSDDDFDPSSEASPALAEKPSKKKAKPRGSRRRNLPEEEEEGRCSAPQREPEDRDDGTSPKKKKNVDALRYGVDLTEFDQSPELTAKYAAMSTTELGQWLKANLVVRPATKAHMVALVRGRRALGRDPTMSEVPRRAPEGALRVSDAHAGQGEWTCGGTYDKDLNMYVKCYFTAKPGEVERLPWRDLHDPAPDPRAAAAAADADADAELPPGFASFGKPEAAAAIKAIAVKLGFQLPVENANAEIGGCLLPD